MTQQQQPETVQIDQALTVPTDSSGIRFPIADQAIKEMANRYSLLEINGIDDRDGFRAVHEARMVVKNARVDIDKKRKELKADALDYGRRVDAEAKRLTELIMPIESHLAAEEKKVVDEKKRIKEEEKRQENAKIDERVNRLLELEFAYLGHMSRDELLRMSDCDFDQLVATAMNDLERRREAEAMQAAETKRVDKEVIRLRKVLLAKLEYPDLILLPDAQILKMPDLEFDVMCRAAKSQQEQRLKEAEEEAKAQVNPPEPDSDDSTQDAENLASITATEMNEVASAIERALTISRYRVDGFESQWAKVDSIARIAMNAIRAVASECLDGIEDRR